MAMRIGNLSEKSFDQGLAISVAHFGRSYLGCWNSNEPQAGQSLLRGGDPKVKQAAQLLQHAKHLGLQLPEQESSTTLSPGQSWQEMSVAGGSNSCDNSLSYESGQDENCGRSVKGENKPFFLFGSSEMVSNGSQADETHPTVQVSYPPGGNPDFGGFVSAFGLPASVGSHQLQGSKTAGVALARVPLLLNFSEDGPIFVNAKQYHGILRRRQSRAKLEAQIRLVKARKPYLHESRHRHALNRVRGSGGRFLSTKKLQEQNPSSGSCVTDANTRKGPNLGSSSLSVEEEVYEGERFYGNGGLVVGGGKSSLALY